MNKNKKITTKLVGLVMALTMIFTMITPRGAHADTEAVLDGSMSIIGIATDFLKTFFPEIEKALNKDAINSGADIERLSFMPPDFAQGKFFISMYDGINPNNSTLSYRVKIYPENNANNAKEITLNKSFQQYAVTTDFQTPNLIFEFYNGSETTPFERYYLPYEKQNQNYAIALGCNKKVYYLQKETGRVYNRFGFETIWGPKYSSAEYDRVYNSLSQDEKIRYDYMLLRKSRKIDKSAMSPSNYVDNQSILNALNTWKQPGHVAPTRPLPNQPFPLTIEAENYDAMGGIVEKINATMYYRRPDDYTMHKVYIPNDGIYKIGYTHRKFTYVSNMRLSEKYTGEVYEDMKLPYQSTSGYTTTYGKEINLTKGVHYLELKLMDYNQAYIDKLLITPVSFNESFEGGISGWSIGKGTPSISTAKASSGLSSFAMDEDTDVIFRTLSFPSNKIVTMKFYDNASNTSAQAMGNVCSNNWNDANLFVGLGVDKYVSTNKYIVRIGNTKEITNIARTTGWHELKWDYRSGNDVKLYIDNILVKTDSNFKNFNVIALGDWWGENNFCRDMFFDDVILGD